jgi:hypothetical protein
MSNTTIYVQYTTSSGFQWGKSQSSLVPLTTKIDTVSGSRVTYEFVSIASITLYYKLPPSTPSGTVLPTSNGPTALVSPNDEAEIAFATSSSGTYYTGTVTVSDDDIDP